MRFNGIELFIKTLRLVSSLSDGSIVRWDTIWYRWFNIRRGWLECSRTSNSNEAPGGSSERSHARRAYWCEMWRKSGNVGDCWVWRAVLRHHIFSRLLFWSEMQVKRFYNKLSWITTLCMMKKLQLQNEITYSSPLRPFRSTESTMILAAFCNYLKI